MDACSSVSNRRMATPLLLVMSHIRGNIYFFCRARRMSWVTSRDSKREQLEGSLLTVCTDCKEMVIQVQKSSLLKDASVFQRCHCRLFARPGRQNDYKWCVQCFSTTLQQLPVNRDFSTLKNKKGPTGCVVRPYLSEKSTLTRLSCVIVALAQ